MRAFLMAAGRGHRLEPLTDVLPKPALPVAGEPVMGRLLRLMARHGIRDVAVNASWLADLLQDTFGDGSAWGTHIHWSLEPEMLGTAGGMKHLDAFLRDGEEPILVLSGDGLHEVDLSELVRIHHESGALATIALKEIVDPSQYGVVVLDDDGFVTAFQEKPPIGTEHSKLANTGIYVFDPSVLDLIPEGMYDFGEQLFPRILAEGLGRLRGVTVDGYWNDIGGLDAYRLGNLAVVSGELSDDAAESEYGTGLLIHPTARIGRDVELTAPCVIGPDVVIDDGCHIVDSVILPGTHVAPRTTLIAGTLGSLDGLVAWADALR